MMLRIETRSGNVFYIEDSFILYSKQGRQTAREISKFKPVDHYAVIFDSVNFGIGNESVGFIPTAAIERINVQEDTDENLEAVEKVEGAFRKPGRKSKQ